LEGVVQPRDWPDDADVHGLIFLPRFVNQIGVRVCADWTGTEVTTPSEVYLLPKLIEADNGDRLIASSLLWEHRPDLGWQNFLPPPGSAADNARRHELWRIAQQVAEREYNAPPRRWLRSIWAEIRRQSCAGELTLKIRRKSGGPFAAFQSVWWNRDNPNELFDHYTIDPEYPFGGGPSWKPNSDSWIFAPREIDQIAARLTVPPEADRQSEQKGNPIWDWLGLIKHLKKQKRKLTFITKEDALEYYQHNVQRIDQMKAGDGPDKKSVRTARKKYNLDQYVIISRPST
jgi:hypothetical protein